MQRSEINDTNYKVIKQGDHMKLQNVITCLDCNYAGAPARVNGVDQCPQCASRSVWFVSCWSKPPWLTRLTDYQSNTAPHPHCSDITPSFFGGTEH